MQPMCSDGPQFRMQYRGFLSPIMAVLPALIVPASHAISQTTSMLTTLYSFTGPTTDGANPESAMVFGTDGVLYGVTFAGGTANLGTVFRLTPQAGGAWIETVLHSFTGGITDGSAPLGGLIVSGGGTLYGTTEYGGTPNSACGSGCGTVFAMVPPKVAGGAWTESIVYRFTGLNGDGSTPRGGVVVGQGGVLYGTTAAGGSGGKGIVYALMPPAQPGGAWTEMILHTFLGMTSQDGAVPTSALVIGAGGVLFGTTNYGGTAGFGTAFEMIAPASLSGAWTETVLCSFTGKGGDGSVPFGSLTLGKTGVIYGTTDTGGTAGKGTVFQLIPLPGGAWIQTVLYSFTGKNGDGSGPLAGVVIGLGGALYGTTYGGGLSPKDGTVFKLEAPVAGSGPWTETVLYSFRGPLGGYGSGPLAGLVVGSAGALFGVTQYGGTGSDGTVFELKP